MTAEVGRIGLPTAMILPVLASSAVEDASTGKIIRGRTAPR
ncbi:hypothetical protein [Nocardiopsis quinghaiensis]|nr:hypothetical protein [Nocardiopsis quinghaiensis]